MKYLKKSIIMYKYWKDNMICIMKYHVLCEIQRHVESFN